MQKLTLINSTKECINPFELLGYEGENEANKLVFEFEEDFIDGLGIIYVKRNEEPTGTIELKKVGETYELPVERSLVSKEGEIVFQVEITTTKGETYKYSKFVMRVDDALDSDIPIPEEYPSWIELANSKLAELEEAVEKSEKVVDELVKAKENGEFNGQDGEDGFSPSAKVTQTEEGAEIEITDKDGTTKAVVKHGQGGGGAGQDGFSPIATVTETIEGAEIEITDKNGTTKATVYNGQDGKDGVSPSAKVTETVNGALIEIKDKDGTTIAHVENGKDGKDLTNPPIQDITTVLQTNSLYRGTISDNIAFVLPTVTDNTKLNTIQIQTVISNYENITIDLGTTKFFGDIPELGNGSFILYYEYDGTNWCVGALPVVSEV